MTAQIATWIAAVGFFGLICFQLLLAIGLPLGQAAWGGKYRILPIRLRIASLLAAIITALALVIIMEKAEVFALFNNQTVVTCLTWIFTGYFGLNIFMNLLSKSRLEKRIMTPVATVLFIMCLLVALTSG